jgi:glycosyltransferase involved in cell wall biosynthesis
MHDRAAGLYICYWSLMDPLCQSQSLPYLRHLAAREGNFALLTFEQARYRLDPARAAAARRELARDGIDWHPLTYHKRYPLLATGLDCLLGVLKGMAIVWHRRPGVVHSRGSIPAAVALALRWLCRLRFLYDADSRLSEEYADNGHWARGGLAFRITARVEAWARQSADAVVVLSQRLRDDFLGPFGVRAPVEVIPCCVDTARFRHDAAARASRRRELGLADEKLFVYVGKLGPRYLVSEAFAFFKAARQGAPGARLLVLSGDPPEGFAQLAARHGLGGDVYTVRSAAHADVPGWLSAADAGLAFIRPAGCERGSSPVKIGEYLAVGLPVVMTAGIGDYSDLVQDHDAGVVLGVLDEAAYQDGARRLLALWAQGDPLPARCRAAATEHCDLERVGWERYRRVYRRLLGK